MITFWIALVPLRHQFSSRFGTLFSMHIRNLEVNIANPIKQSCMAKIGLSVVIPKSLLLASCCMLLPWPMAPPVAAAPKIVVLHGKGCEEGTNPIVVDPGRHQGRAIVLHRLFVDGASSGKPLEARWWRLPNKCWSKTCLTCWTHIYYKIVNKYEIQTQQGTVVEIHVNKGW